MDQQDLVHNSGPIGLHNGREVDGIEALTPAQQRFLKYLQPRLDSIRKQYLNEHPDDTTVVRQFGVALIDEKLEVPEGMQLARYAADKAAYIELPRPRGALVGCQCCKWNAWWQCIGYCCS